LDLRILPKVGLNDIFVEKLGAKAGQYARYAQMHLDYLVVRRQTYRPVAGIELSGSSHEPDRQRMRDTKKDGVFRAAGLPLLRFGNGFRDADIRQQLQAMLGGQWLTR